MLNQEEQLYCIKGSYLITGITLSRTLERNSESQQLTHIKAFLRVL